MRPLLAALLLLAGCGSGDRAAPATLPPPERPASASEPVYAPNNNSGAYDWDHPGVGVIDVEPSDKPYQVGPNPPRQAKPR